MSFTRKKILYVFGGEQASGAEIVMERLINYNLESVEPHIFISPGWFAEKLLTSGKGYKIVQVKQLRKLNRSSNGKGSFYMKAITNHFSVSSQVLKYTSRNDIDIIHAVTVVPATYCIPAIVYSRITGIKKLWVWSDYDIKHFAKLDHYFSAMCHKMFNITLAASGAVKNKYPTTDKVKVLYNGLDTNVFIKDNNARASFRQKFSIKDEAILFGIAGVVSPRKGQLELIKAFSEATKSSSDVQLILAGGFGPDFEEYNQQVRTLSDTIMNVKYIGQISNMVEFFNGCDIIVNNSTSAGSEPLGTTIYEAMSCETIVIGSNTGGTPEIIDDGINGFLFEPDSHVSLVTMIKFLVTNIATLTTIKKAAREKVKEKFTIKKLMSQYKLILNNI